MPNRRFLPLSFGISTRRTGFEQYEPSCRARNQRILVSQEPREKFLTRHLVDTAASLVANHRFVGLVRKLSGLRIRSNKCSLPNRYFHDVVFTHPHESLFPHTIQFRPSSLGQPLTFANVFYVLTFIRTTSLLSFNAGSIPSCAISKTHYYDIC